MKSSIKELKKRLAELVSQIDDLSTQREKVRQQIAELSTTLKVGDRVSYEGAELIWELREIKPGYGDGCQPKFFGSKLKKDGTPSAAILEIYQVPYNKKLVLASTLKTPATGSKSVKRTHPK